MDGNWVMKITFTGRDFNNLKWIAKEILSQVVKAKTYKEFPISGAGGSGQSGNDFSFHVEYTCPTEQRIASLRAEADELEKTLKP